MIDPSLEAQLDGILEYARFLPGKKKHPLEILVLRGHLLIEREVRALVLAKFKREKAFDLGRLFTSDVARLAEAIYGDAIPDHTWEDFKQLNIIRNSLAHNLVDDTLAPRIRKFVARFKERDPKTFKFVKELHCPSPPRVLALPVHQMKKSLTAR